MPHHPVPATSAALFALLLAGGGWGQSAEIRDISSVPPDLHIPPLSAGPPGAGLRVAQATPGWETTAAHHLLYLPADWTPRRRFPVLVEYAGNGGFKNTFGDVSDGTVEGSRLGYGLSGGVGFIWICMPFVEVAPEGGKQNAAKWWGNVEETKRYCIATVKDVCQKWGGDRERVILCGFSRGSIACNYIGLHDDEIASLWAGFLCHSHYDGVIEAWRYPLSDRDSALTRLQRLGSRPQFISHEGSVAATEKWLSSTGLKGRWTFVGLPYRNHSDEWVLRDIPERRQAREWLQQFASTPEPRFITTSEMLSVIGATTIAVACLVLWRKRRNSCLEEIDSCSSSLL